MVSTVMTRICSGMMENEILRATRSNNLDDHNAGSFNARTK